MKKIFWSFENELEQSLHGFVTKKLERAWKWSVSCLTNHTWHKWNTSTLLFVSKALFKHLMLRRNFTALTSCAFFSECAKKSSFVLYLEVVVAEKMILSKENRRFFAEAVVEKKRRFLWKNLRCYRKKRRRSERKSWLVSWNWIGLVLSLQWNIWLVEFSYVFLFCFIV